MRRLENALRAADSRFHSAASVARSACGAAFHSSTSWRSRSPPLFQCVASAAIRSASATIRSLISLACDPRLVAGGLGLLAAVADVLGQPFQPGPEPVEVADRVGLGHRSHQPLDAGGGLGGGQVGRGDPLLEQLHLGPSASYLRSK